MSYKFQCRSCQESMYFENKPDINTNFKCPNCQTDNWIDSSWQGLEVATEDEFDVTMVALVTVRVEKPNINNTGLSEKYDVLETYKLIVYITMVLGTGFIIYSLKQFFDISEQSRDALQNQMIISVVSYIITMFSLYCITKMIDFLFDLDKKTDNNV